MAHHCPNCGCICHCHGDIDDICLDLEEDMAFCECCSDYEDPWEDDDDDWDYYRDVDDDFLKEPIYGIPHPGCSCSRSTDEYHGWECTITDGECMFLSPDSKQCAKEYGEGPDAEG